MALGADILYKENLDFGYQLREHKCEVTIREIPDYPHMALSMQNVPGKGLVREMIDFLRMSLSEETRQVIKSGTCEE